MMTLQEAKRRAEVHNGRIVFSPEYGEYCCTLNEWRGEDAKNKAYYTDDIEDAVLTLGALRRRQDVLQGV